MTKMEEYAASLNMDPTIFDYDCIIKDGRWKYSICHSKEIEELITELAKKYIAYLNLKDNRFGALLEIMKGMACIIFDDKIIGKELQKQKISQ